MAESSLLIYGGIFVIILLILLPIIFRKKRHYESEEELVEDYTERLREEALEEKKGRELEKEEEEAGSEKGKDFLEETRALRTGDQQAVAKAAADAAEKLKKQAELSKKKVAETKKEERTIKREIEDLEKIEKIEERRAEIEGSEVDEEIAENVKELKDLEEEKLQLEKEKEKLEREEEKEEEKEADAQKALAKESGEGDKIKELDDIKDTNERWKEEDKAKEGEKKIDKWELELDRRLQEARAKIAREADERERVRETAFNSASPLLKKTIEILENEADYAKQQLEEIERETESHVIKDKVAEFKKFIQNEVRGQRMERMNPDELEDRMDWVGQTRRTVTFGLTRLSGIIMPALEVFGKLDPGHVENIEDGLNYMARGEACIGEKCSLKGNVVGVEHTPIEELDSRIEQELVDDGLQTLHTIIDMEKTGNKKAMEDLRFILQSGGEEPGKAMEPTEVVEAEEPREEEELAAVEEEGIEIQEKEIKEEGEAIEEEEEAVEDEEEELEEEGETGEEVDEELLAIRERKKQEWGEYLEGEAAGAEGLTEEAGEGEEIDEEETEEGLTEENGMGKDKIESMQEGMREKGEVETEEE